MRWTAITRAAISLPMAMLAACALIGINEIGYDRSTQAVAEIAQAQQTRADVNRLLQHMLDAETGQRGYLLTGDPRYLEPYNRAMADIHVNLETLRQFYTRHPQELPVFASLADSVARKLSEMDVSVRLRKQGNEDAWKFVLTTDVGKEQMDQIRSQATQLIAWSTDQMTLSQEQITQSLQLSRLGIAAVALAALLAFYLYLRQTTVLRQSDQRQQHALQQERDQLDKLVKERTASLAELATHLQEVREQERGHLARELHDELGALLTAAKLDVARLKSRIGGELELHQRLQHLNDALNSGIALKRRIIEDLRPSSLANLGLVASLEILAREVGERSGLQIDTELENVDVGEGQQLTLYRLVQESLTNIAKYARAHKVEVSLQNYGRYVSLSVKDDGQGFDVQRIRPSSHGLAGMRHRVEASGGQLSVVSAVGQGTRITASLPKAAG